MASHQESSVSKRRDSRSSLVLNLEMEATQPRILSLFRESFLAWLKDRSASRFSRDVGAPLHVTLEEFGDGADHASTLRLSVSWSQEAPCPEEGLLPAVHPEVETERFKFFEDTQEKPLVNLEPAPDDEEIAAALRYAELMRRRPRPVTRKLATKAAALAERSGRYASRALRTGATNAAPFLRAARRLADRAVIFAARAMQALRGLWAGGKEVTSMAAPALRARRDAIRASVGALSTRVQPSPALRVPAILAAVSVLLVIGTVAFVLRDGRAVPDRVSGTTAAVVQPVATSGTPAVERGPLEQPRADTPVPKPETDALSPTVAAQAALDQPPPVPAKRTRVAANRRNLAPALTRYVKAPERRIADTRALAVGMLQVGSEPSGAEVFVNGVPQGRTPLLLKGLPPGSRVVRLDMPGYVRWSWSVAVVANKRTPLIVKLQPNTRRAGVAGAASDFTPRLP